MQLINRLRGSSQLNSLVVLWLRSGAGLAAPGRARLLWNITLQSNLIAMSLFNFPGYWLPTPTHHRGPPRNCSPSEGLSDVYERRAAWLGCDHHAFQNKAEWPSVLEPKDIAEEGFIYVPRRGCLYPVCSPVDPVMRTGFDIAAVVFLVRTSATRFDLGAIQADSVL